MDLANMRENGVRSLEIMCQQCRHQTIINVDRLPGDLTVPSFGRRMALDSVRSSHTIRAKQTHRTLGYRLRSRQFGRTSAPIVPHFVHT
jgi:hypothetical protein